MKSICVHDILNEDKLVRWHPTVWKQNNKIYTDVYLNPPILEPYYINIMALFNFLIISSMLSARTVTLVSST